MASGRRMRRKEGDIHFWRSEWRKAAPHSSIARGTASAPPHVMEVLSCSDGRSS